MEDADFWKPLGSLTREDLETLLGKPERAVLDYKQARSIAHISPEALGDDLCAFANTGLGRIVIGAEERGRDDAARFPGRGRLRQGIHACRDRV